ncbi:hypothetical protein M8C21_012941 [Ambrosia artemisiifolia]|uniref:Uncharacterized protein n=1 Tax=Ambrosia artemisiifolia TaxID=4212 RepID=A0AAD5G6P3_AMBAR|nr:hypothetical protein M8C21_012941 [Ambrosia artemisiifolia]
MYGGHGGCCHPSLRRLPPSLRIGGVLFLIVALRFCQWVTGGGESAKLDCFSWQDGRDSGDTRYHMTAFHEALMRA